MRRETVECCTLMRFAAPLIDPSRATARKILKSSHCMAGPCPVQICTRRVEISRIQAWHRCRYRDRPAESDDGTPNPRADLTIVRTRCTVPARASREEKHRAQYNHHSGAIPPDTADQPRGGDAPVRVERPEVPQFAGIDPEVLPAGGGWAHGRRHLSVGIACRGRGNLQRGVARVRREGVWQRA